MSEFVYTCVAENIASDVYDALEVYLDENPKEWEKVITITKMHRLELDSDQVEELVKKDIVEKVKRDLVCIINMNNPVLHTSHVINSLVEHIQAYLKIYDASIQQVTILPESITPQNNNRFL